MENRLAVSPGFVCCSTPSSTTPFRSSTEQRLVVLFDWWLMRVQGDLHTTRLAVCGLTTKGQQATRLFRSAPITKRYDAYTLETTDGIMVKIQGVVNKTHMHQNGFPPEVCNYFLTGFPYSWDTYVDGSFVKKFTSPTISTNAYGVDELCKGSAGGSSCIFPPHTDDNLISSVVDFFKSGDGIPVDDMSTRYVVERMKKFSDHVSMNTATKMAKELGSLEETFHSEEAHGGHSIVNEMTTCVNPTGDCSITENENAGRVEETHGDTQMVRPLGDVTGSQNHKHVAVNVPVGPDKVNHTLDSILCRSDDQCAAANSADLGMKSVSDDVVRQDENNVEFDLLRGHGLGISSVADDITPEDADNLEAELFKGQCGAEVSRSCVNDVLMGFQMKRFFNTEGPNVSKTKTHSPIKASLGSDVAKSIESLKASYRRTKDCQLRNRNFKFDHDHADVNNTQGESTVINNFTASTASFSKSSEQYDVDDACLQNLEEIESRHVNTVSDPIAQEDSVADLKGRKTSGSEVDFGENLSSRDSWHVTKDLLPTGNGNEEVNNYNISLAVGKFKFTSREAGKRKSVSRSKLQSSPKETAIPVKPGTGNVQQVSNISGPRTRSRMKQAKNREINDEVTKFSLEEIERNKVMPVERDPSFANVVDDGRRKHKKRKHQDIPRTEAHKVLDNMQLGDGHPCFNCSIEHAAQSDIPVHLHISKNKKAHIDSKKTRKKSTQHENLSEDSTKVPLSKGKPLRTRGRKTIWRSSYQNLECSLTRDKARKLSLASPEALNLRRSRSGRLLVPTLAGWCQHIVYDANGSIAGIAGVDMLKSPCTAGSKSEPLTKKKKFI